MIMLMPPPTLAIWRMMPTVPIFRRSCRSRIVLFVVLEEQDDHAVGAQARG